MAEYKILDQKAFIEKGVKLFGSDFNQWVFICPLCGTSQDFWLHAEILGTPHEQITPYNKCVKGCDVLTREFKTVVCLPGADVEVFEFGSPIVYTGKHENSDSAKASLKSARKASVKALKSDFVLNVEAKTAGVNVSDLKKERDKRIKKLKEVNKINYLNRLRLQKIKMVPMAEIIKREKNRVKNAGVTPYMQRKAEQINQTIAQQIQTAKASLNA